MRSGELTKIVLMCALVGCLHACGQKGPLRLPDEGGAVVTRPGNMTRPTRAPEAESSVPQENTRSNDEGVTPKSP